MQHKQSKLHTANTIQLFITGWAGLPLLLWPVAHLAMAQASPASTLFLLYSSFVWFIALLIFVMESSRRRILGSEVTKRCGFRLASMGGVSILVALLFSPLAILSHVLSVLVIMLIASVYGLVFGWYWCLRLDQTSRT